MAASSRIIQTAPSRRVLVGAALAAVAGLLGVCLAEAPSRPEPASYVFLR